MFMFWAITGSNCLQMEFSSQQFLRQSLKHRMFFRNQYLQERKERSKQVSQAVIQTQQSQANSKESWENTASHSFPVLSQNASISPQVQATPKRCDLGWVGFLQLRQSLKSLTRKCCLLSYSQQLSQQVFYWHFLSGKSMLPERIIMPTCKTDCHSFPAWKGLAFSVIQIIQTLWFQQVFNVILISFLK